MKASAYVKLIIYNIKISFGVNTIAAILLVLLTPIFFNLYLVAYNEIAIIGELYLSVIGIILLTYACSIEERYNVKEIVYLRRMPFTIQFSIRLLVIFLFIALLQLIIIAICKIEHGAFNFNEILTGIWITSVFLGMIGLTLSNITHDIKSGYLVAFAYYMFEFFTRGKYTSSFYIFSLLNGDFSCKYYVLALVIALISINYYIIWKRS